MKKRDKKGLSAIVTTLIIILLAIAAFAIVAKVIMPLIQESTEKIKLSSECLDVDLQVTKVINETGGNYSVSLKRGTTGDSIDGYILIFVNAADDDSVYSSIPGQVDRLYKKTIRVTNLTDFAPATVRVISYFLTEAEDTYFCGEGQMFAIPQPIPTLPSDEAPDTNIITVTVGGRVEALPSITWIAADSS